MSDIFISYASEDKNRVTSLAHALERKGWSVWWDRRIPAGKSFDEVIHEALKAAKSVVVVWSNTSVKSTWVKNESRSGLRRGVLFPVMLLEEVEIPLEFEHLQAAHLMDWHPGQAHAGFDQFLDDLAGIIGTPLPPVVQPPPVPQSLEPPIAPTRPTPEQDREPLPQRTDSVEPVSGQLDEQPFTPATLSTSWDADGHTAPVEHDEKALAASSTPTLDREPAAKSRKSKRRGSGPRTTGTKQPIEEARSAAQDLGGEPVVSLKPTEGAELIHTDHSAGADYSDYPTHPVGSTSSFSFLPIGLGLLAVIGALVYFLVFSQGPSPGPRDVVPYQSAAEPTTTGKDGALMVLVPAGEFMMGSREEDKSADEDERSAHPVYLDAFYIDQYEVTTARYAKFFQQTNRRSPMVWPDQVLQQHGRKPVVGVDWNDAAAYCTWVGKRLPTEAEWEKTARGTDKRQYPWGNAPPSKTLANFDHCCDFKDYGALTDVGSFEGGKSSYGAYDLAGNALEWVADWYATDYYNQSPSSLSRNPKGPSRGDGDRVLRGGSWHFVPGSVRSAFRYKKSPSVRNVYIGFRCAQDIPN